MGPIYRATCLKGAIGQLALALSFQTVGGKDAAIRSAIALLCETMEVPPIDVIQDISAGSSSEPVT